MSEDYYQTLGLKRNADAAAIKKAYRKLAMKYHPDQNPDDPAAEEKFKELNEAHETLKDPVKRQNYDTFGTADPAQSGFQRPAGSSDPFEHIFRDVGGFDSFFRSFGGNPRRQSRNSDLMAEMRIPLEDAFKGTTVPFEVTMPDGGKKNLRLTVPPGVETGHRFKMPGKGPQQNTNIPAGDLYVTVHVNEHPTFKRMGADLFVTKAITMAEAALGKETEVSCIDGTSVKVTIPPGTQPNHRMRLKNKGMSRFNSMQRGDLYIGMEITVPTNLTKRQKELLEEFQAESLSKASK